jgi:hypothetical protein
MIFKGDVEGCLRKRAEARRKQHEDREGVTKARERREHSQDLIKENATKEGAWPPRPGVEGGAGGNRQA